MKINKKVYLVIVASGSYDDYQESVQFVTGDIDKAEKWIKRYNNIIEDNTDRIKNYVFSDEEKDQKEPFWFWKIYYEKSTAMLRESEYRN